MSNATKAAEIIADAATPAVDTAMRIGEAIAENIDKPVEVVFEVIQKTPLNVKKAALITAGVVALGGLAAGGYVLWTKRKNAKKVIDGEVLENLTSIPEQSTSEASENVGAKNKSK